MTGRSIHLLGTNHAHQLIGYSEGAALKFSTYLSTLVEKLRPTLIAEELNADAIGRWRAKTLTAHFVANTTGIRHIFCDPNASERENIGIKTFEQIRDELGYNKFLSDKEAAHAEAVERETMWPKREAEWLRRITESRSTSTLMIVGSRHVATFSALAVKGEYKVSVLCEKWEP